MSGEIAGFGAGVTPGPVPFPRPRARKAWEFSWDDDPTPAAWGGPGRRADGSRADVSWPSRTAAAGGLPWTTGLAPSSRRMRKAWEFSWDDEAPSPANNDNRTPQDGAVAATTGVSQASAAQVGNGRESARSDAVEAVIPDGDGLAAPAGGRRRRRRADAVAVGDTVDDTNVAEAPRRRGRRHRPLTDAPETSASPSREEALPQARDVPHAADVMPAPSALSEAPAPRSSPVEVAPAAPMEEEPDLAAVLSRLAALGGDRDERELGPDTSWIQPKRGNRPVQVVRVGAARAARAMARDPKSPRDDSALRADPLVSRALRIAEILQDSSPEEHQLIELRRAVREMREVVAGVEAQAYGRNRSKAPPLFFQAYDPRTRTG